MQRWRNAGCEGETSEAHHQRRNLWNFLVMAPSRQARQDPERGAYKALLRGVLGKIRASGVLDSKTGTMAVHGTAIALEALGRHGALPTRNHTSTTHPRYAEMG